MVLENNNHPLVSIVVISYNSSNFILETLESIKLQTYKNIELIISDDCSTDNTVSLCQNWIEENENFFNRVKVITVLQNSGIPSNVNRGVNTAKGEWIKLIAGDDILLDNCIHDNVSYVIKNKTINFLFSKPIYINSYSETIISHNSKKFKKNDSFYNLTARKQYLHLLTENHPINPPTLFFNKKVVDSVGRFDENFKNEDFPFYLKITKLGYKLFFLNQETIKYRIHSSSISQKVKQNKGVSDWNFDKLKNTIVPQVNTNLSIQSPLIVLDIYNKLLFYNVLLLLGNTKKNKKKLSFIRWLSPLVILRKFKMN